MALDPRHSPASAAAWLTQLPNSNTWPKGDGQEDMRQRAVSNGVQKIMSTVPSWDGFFQTDSTRALNGKFAWQMAGEAVVAAKLPKPSQDALLELALAHIEALAGQAERNAQGETWGVGGAARLAADMGTTAVDLGADAMVGVGLPNLLDPQQAPGGTGALDREKAREEAEKNPPFFTPLKLLKWGLPILAVGGGIWYLWPIIGAALKVRKSASAGLDRATARLDAAPAGLLPAPQGQRDTRPWQSGSFHPQGLLGAEFAVSEVLPPVDMEGAADQQDFAGSYNTFRQQPAAGQLTNNYFGGSRNIEGPLGAWDDMESDFDFDDAF